MERPFGVAPSLSADIALDDLDLLALTGVFDFGSITGRLDGRIDDLRLVDWSRDRVRRASCTPTASAGVAPAHQPARGAEHLQRRRRVVRHAALQGQLIGLFDDFGYSRIGISCRLANEVCEMGGPAFSRAAAFTIVEGAGLPRLTVVGFNRLVDWPTLVERLAAVGKGEVKPVVE